MAVAAVVQLALVLLLAERGPVRARTTEREPRVTLSGNIGGELAALTDPTLHVWGGTAGFSGEAWHPAAAPVRRSPRYTEPPRFLALTAADLTSVETLLAAEPGAGSPPPLPKQSPAPTATPDVLATTSLPAASACEVVGELASRWQSAPMRLPSQPPADLLADTVVQLRVDAAGRVQSCTLLARSGLPAADELALRHSRDFRFAPVPGARPLSPAPATPLTTGEAVFHWQIVPPAAAAPGA